MRAHVRFALYRDVLRVLAQLDEPGSGASETECPAPDCDLTSVLATLATLTPPCSGRRAELRRCLENVLERFGVTAPYDEAPEMLRAA
jgi:hypothetical protein